MNPLSVDFRHIIAHEGSQAKAFEELVCQIAMRSKPEGSQYQRIGTPDTGVECLVDLPNGDQWGYQAKYFDQVGAPQWKQIGDSVKSALTNRPKLTRYYVFVPFNLPGAVSDRRKSALQKWDENVLRWKKYKRDGPIEISYVNASDILAKLILEKNEDLRSYFFGGSSITFSSLKAITERTLVELSGKYDSLLNVPVDMEQTLDALVGSDAFLDRINEKLRQLRESLRYPPKTLSPDGSEVVSTIKHQFRSYEFLSKQALIELSRAIESINSRLETATKQERKIEEAEGKERDGFYFLLKVQTEVYELEEMLSSADTAAYLRSNLIIKGEGGIGKSQVLCHYATKLLDHNVPVLLLQGGSFGTGDVIKQICDLAEISARPSQLIKILDLFGQVNKTAVVLIIDALNESDPKGIWRDKLTALNEGVNKTERVKFVCSVRSDYAQSVLPDSDRFNSLCAFRDHPGFGNNLVEAITCFFNFYKIPIATSSAESS